MCKKADLKLEFGHYVLVVHGMKVGVKSDGWLLFLN